ncbi:MAG: sigma 54-interacting transcriptional regulator [Myxococcota bacterium]
MNLDATTLDETSGSASRRRLGTLRVVFSGDAGIAAEPRVVVLPPALKVGRSVPDGGLTLPDDRQASREHAVFHFDGNHEHCRVVDLGSRNGVKVNGEVVPDAELADGDVIRVGSTFLVYRLIDAHQLDFPVDGLLGASPALQQVRMSIRRVAGSEASVLILSETGTGKELVAQAIHAHSDRQGRVVAVNCSAVTASIAESEFFGHKAGAFTGASEDRTGYFRAAHGGTLFLDEVGDMPLTLQPKLLRALESKTVVPVGGTSPHPFDARVVAATHRDLDELVRAGRFREDLLARLSLLRLELPPLRERREDILLLLLRHLGESPTLATSLIETLLLHDWRKNAREVIAVATELKVWGAGAERLELTHLKTPLQPSEPTPSGASAAPPRHLPARDESAARQPEPPTLERLETLLRTHRGNVAAVARAVGRSRTQVYRLLEQFNIDATSFRRSQ